MHNVMPLVEGREVWVVRGTWPHLKEQQQQHCTFSCVKSMYDLAQMPCAGLPLMCCGHDQLQRHRGSHVSRLLRTTLAIWHSVPKHQITRLSNVKLAAHALCKHTSSNALLVSSVFTLYSLSE
jgi:hypothetical protein